MLVTDVKMGNWALWSKETGSLIRQSKIRQSPKPSTKNVVHRREKCQRFLGRAQASSCPLVFWLLSGVRSGNRGAPAPHLGDPRTGRPGSESVLLAAGDGSGTAIGHWNRVEPSRAKRSGLLELLEFLRFPSPALLRRRYSGCGVPVSWTSASPQPQPQPQQPCSRAAVQPCSYRRSLQCSGGQTKLQANCAIRAGPRPTRKPTQPGNDLMPKAAGSTEFQKEKEEWSGASVPQVREERYHIISSSQITSQFNSIHSQDDILVQIHTGIWSDIFIVSPYHLLIP